MKITVCIGSSCHLKGAREVVNELQSLIAENNLQDKIDLAGTFCMGNCQKGVCVSFDNKPYSVTPSNTKTFFETKVLSKL